MSVFIERIKIKNLLSFDEEGIDFELKPLNVLIGANASGKSNFVKGLQLLCSTATSISSQVSKFGGIDEILNKNSKKEELSFDVKFAQNVTSIGADYRIELGTNHGYFEILDESFRLCNTDKTVEKVSETFQLFARYGDKAWLHALKKADSDATEVNMNFEVQELGPKEFDFSKSVFEQRRDPVVYRDITVVSDIFANASTGGFFSPVDIDLSRNSNKADEFSWYLWHDGSNLPVVLSKLDKSGILHSEILPRIREFYPNIKDIRTVVVGGRIELQVWENSLSKPVSLAGVSSGTIAFLRILSALFNTEAFSNGRLICFEEPETGFHPEAIPILAQCFKDAPIGTQLVITTHSPLLLECFDPESILVVEKEGNTSKFERKSRTDLKRWLKRYTLGELWLKGVIGGTRY